MLERSIRKMVSKFFALFIILPLVGSISSEERTVQTRVGRIRGTRADDGDYYQFMGIPYGVVDDNNRFGLASPYPEFEYVFEANDDSVVCPQLEFSSGLLQGVIDCLHLNIYVPATASVTNPLPVMLWVHGGSFTSGSGTRSWYGPKFLVKHDVILVTVNYRLGFYGFMCTDIPQVPGNQGMRDLVMGMRWVKDNIGYFGGDKDKITVFGESAGSMLIDLLLLADIEEEEELFHNVIIMSGTSLIPLIVRPPDNNNPIVIANNLGLSTNNVTEALSFLNTVQPFRVILAGLELVPAPCNENEFDGVKRLLSDFPVNMAVPRAKGRSFLMGYNSDEAMFLFANLLPIQFQNLDTFNDIISTVFHFDNTTHDEMVRLMRNFYIGDKVISREVVYDLSDFISDVTYVHPTERSVTKVLDNGAEKVYYYKFSYIGDRNFMRRLFDINIGGATHADELGYLFNVDFLSELGSPEDFAMRDKVTTLWTNFAKYGDPIPERTPLLPIKWEPVTQDSLRHYMDIDSELTLDQRPFQKRVAFWELLQKAYGEYEYGFARENSAS